MTLRRRYLHQPSLQALVFLLVGLALIIVPVALQLGSSVLRFGCVVVGVAALLRFALVQADVADDDYAALAGERLAEREADGHTSSMTGKTYNGP